MSPPPSEQHPDIVVLAVTEDTLATLPFRALISRRFLTTVLTTIEQKGVRAVGLDILFDQPTDLAEDAALRLTLENYSKPIVAAIGNEQSNLTPRQLAFQAEYLASTVCSCHCFKINVKQGVPVQDNDLIIRDYFQRLPDCPASTQRLIFNRVIQ